MYLLLWWLAGLAGVAVYRLLWTKTVNVGNNPFWCISPAGYCLALIVSGLGPFLLFTATVTYMAGMPSTMSNWFFRPVCKK